jgi:penicillin-binding protein 2
MEGKSGLEGRLEPLLAGTPGLERDHRDARGRSLGPPEVLRESIPGADVTLTIDAEWQRHAYGLLATSSGSIVVVEADSGAIRVLAGSPGFDPDRPAAPLPDGRPASQLNRPARAAMPPGSVVKPFVAIAGYRAGVSPEAKTHCGGSVRLAGWLRPFHCNVRSGHGDVDLARSLQVSCNVYYFQLVQRTGASRMLDELRRFGFGTPTGCGLPGEAAGQPSGEPEPSEGESLNLSIGQGRMLATPLQIARAYAAIANGGTLPGLHVVESAVRADGTQERVPSGPRETAAIPAEARAAILEGLYRAVNASGGTARKAGFAPEWRVCGKTGTVENPQGTSDAWFAGFYPRENPRYVVVVQVEDVDGHGGEIAAPVARDMIAFMEGAAPATPPPALQEAAALP